MLANDEGRKEKIDKVEMDYLRKECGISRMEYKPNTENRRRTGRAHKTLEWVETRQLVWHGHVQRMEVNTWPEIVLEYNPINRRKQKANNLVDKKYYGSHEVQSNKGEHLEE